MRKVYDVIIIGGGICGFTSAMYAGRLGMKVLVLEGGTLGGAVATTNLVENWPGIKRISGEELALKVMEHAREYGVAVERRWAESVERGGERGCFMVKAGDRTFEGRTIIFATGARHRRHPAKNAELFENKGVHYCALCDGPLYTGKKVAVIGGGDSAAKEALLLTEYAEKVYLLVRGEKLRAEQVNVKRVESSSKITVLTGAEVLEMKGGSKLEALVMERQGRVETLPVSAAFIAIGTVPRSELAAAMGVRTNEKGEIVIDRRASTNIEGVFACGDVTDTRFKQAITGAGEAVTAAYWAYAHVNEKDYVCPHGEEKP